MRALQLCPHSATHPSPPGGVRQADQFTTVSQLQAAVAHHDATPGTGPLQVVTLQGADHFPYARRELVIEQVISWLAQQLGAGTAPASTAPTGAASEPDGRGTAQP